MDLYLAERRAFIFIGGECVPATPMVPSPKKSLPHWPQEIGREVDDQEVSDVEHCPHVARAQRTALFSIESSKYTPLVI